VRARRLPASGSGRRRTSRRSISRPAAEEGIFCGPSAAGACAIALRIAQTLEQATIVFIVFDRGDRYLSTGIFPA
jgi:S-sulfo-L-cysteine synthase (O-acetyl-L-serine-dependent)